MNDTKKIPETENGNSTCSNGKIYGKFIELYRTFYEK